MAYHEKSLSTHAEENAADQKNPLSVLLVIFVLAVSCDHRSCRIRGRLNLSFPYFSLGARSRGVFIFACLPIFAIAQGRQ